jgi:UDP-glucose 4-epimerase
MIKHQSRHEIDTGAGYIGSMLIAELLCQGQRVTVIDYLLFGGGSLLGFVKHNSVNIISGDICRAGTLQKGSIGFPLDRRYRNADMIVK